MFLDKREMTRRLMSPGSKSVRDAAEELVGEKRGGYRSMVPAADYMAVHRRDLQYTASVLIRTLENALGLPVPRTAG